MKTKLPLPSPKPKTSQAKALKRLSLLHQTQDDKDNAIIIACEKGNSMPLLRNLIRIGANPKACGDHPMVWACFTHKQEVVKELAQYYKAKELKEILINRFKEVPSHVQDVIKHLRTNEIKAIISQGQENSQLLEL